MPPNQRPHFFRRKFVSGTQLKSLAVYLTYFLVVLLLYTGMTFVPLIQRLEQLPAESRERYEVSKLFLAYHNGVWPAFFGICVLLSIHWVIVSHRIWGPLERFRRIFEAAKRGDFPERIRLRKNDHFHAEALALEELFRGLRFRIGEAKKALGAAEEHCREALKALDPEEGDSCRALEEARRALAEAQASLAVYRTEIAPASAEGQTAQEEAVSLAKMD